MCHKYLFESLQLLVSICTPIAIVLIGMWINNTIQLQNATVQRQSPWRVTWADDFLKVSAGFNNAATSFVFIYYKYSKYEDGGAENFLSELHPLWQELIRCEWELSKFIDFAPVNGKNLETSVTSLIEEGHNWAKNKGGDVPQFRQKQLAFNMNARKVHAELLGLKNQQD